MTTNSQVMGRVNQRQAGRCVWPMSHDRLKRGKPRRGKVLTKVQAGDDGAQSWESEMGGKGWSWVKGQEEEKAALVSSLVADPSDRNTVVGREKSVSLDWSRFGWGDAGSSADSWNYKLDKRKCNQCPLEVILIIHFICIVCHSFLCFQSHL